MGQVCVRLHAQGRCGGSRRSDRRRLRCQFGAESDQPDRPTQIRQLPCARFADITLTRQMAAVNEVLEFLLLRTKWHSVPSSCCCSRSIRSTLATVPTATAVEVANTMRCN